jgi:hypothetical protein
MSNQQKQIVVAGIKLRSDRPTLISCHQLYQWVIWQFPRANKKYFCGAVRPPGATYGWIPAKIRADKEKIRIYAHLGETFPSPETAVEYFDQND